MAVGDLSRRLADPVQLGQRDHVLVRGDLQHRIGRRVQDQIAGGDVLGAQLVANYDRIFSRPPN